MLRIFVDELEVPLPPSEFGSLDEILQHVEKSYLKPNTVIRQVELDGQPLVTQESQAGPGVSLTEYSEKDLMQIRTGTIWEVARESVLEAVSYLHRLGSATSALATEFRSRPGAAQFVGLKQLFEGFFWLNLLLERIQTTCGFRLDNISFSATSAREVHSRLLSILQEVIRAQEAADHVLLADLLEYEIDPMIPLLIKVFSEIGARIGAPA